MEKDDKTYVSNNALIIQSFPSVDELVYDILDRGIF